MWTTQIVAAIQALADNFHRNEIVILRESDLQYNLVERIKARVDGNISVNTETPWYDIYTTNKSYVIDITAFDKNKLKITYDPRLNRKGYKYDDEAIAIELKFFRYNEDIKSIAGDFKKLSLLVQMPLNDCFIVALARTMELYDKAEKFMRNEMAIYRSQYDKRARVFLLGPEQLLEIL